ncbi:MAG TPA: hypothetical protein VM346_11405 [Sphingomicrobium sp.]|nr:hypothetical protein [Sphingomicrobium sp.]
MRKQILGAASCLAMIAAGPALAQGRGGGAGGGPPGGMPGGMGGGPPMTPPGQMGGGPGTADAARDIASQRGEFGRTFANQQRMTAAERQQLAEQYRSWADQRRANALAIAEEARKGAAFPADAGKRIRLALREDIEAWRDAFQVSRKDWQAMRDEWLAERSTLTPQEWALRRAAWFEARDNWIAQQRGWAADRRR